MDSLPLDIIKYQIYPLLPIKELLSLSQTCKNFLLDKKDWQYLCERDYQRGDTKKDYQHACHIHEISDWYIEEPTKFQSFVLGEMGYIKNRDHYEPSHMTMKNLFYGIIVSISVYSFVKDETMFHLGGATEKWKNLPPMLIIERDNILIKKEYARKVYDFYHGDGDFLKAIYERFQSKNYLQDVIDSFK